MEDKNLSRFIGFYETPPLWIGQLNGIQQFVFPEIDFKDFKPQPLPTNLRLGHQLEQVFFQLINSAATYRILAHNTPVRKNKISLGEIDFIVEDLTANLLIHIELTYKFYLVDPNIPEEQQQLIGPNRRDSFFRKKEKIINHQIPLIYSPEGILALSDLGIAQEALQHHVCFKAQLFVPFTNKSTTLPSFNPKCIIGYWFSFQIFESEGFQEFEYYIPAKKEWPIPPHKDVIWSSHFDILPTVRNYMKNEQSLMIWIKKPLRPIEKHFIVWW
ncbi:hypothetical protein SAMN04487911_109102 [Arenibacter nanhaiticus]|uniref:DUF1853 domain-containing protein n=1 Tax=Arenibacter nanhaiticus TaxID=558155 RepID=A0A1M6FVR5_9FLAO|nr:DUF1853 family protein [Arenibacter nanhaiticus]SHJ01791.1 hypothetical protein SAMN04487911_109102 [Arenibacter nanhaiticus]